MAVKDIFPSHRKTLIEQKIDLHLNRTYQHEHDPKARAQAKAKIMEEFLPLLPQEPERAALYIDEALKAVARGMLTPAEAEKRSELAFDVCRSYTRSNAAAAALLADINRRNAVTDPGVHKLFGHFGIGNAPLIVKDQAEQAQQRRQAADRAAPAEETPK